MSENTNVDYESRDEEHFSMQSVCDENSSAEELRECTEETRASVNRTIHELEQRVTPAGIWNRIRDVFMQGNGRSFSLDQTVSRNPTPFAFIGSGLVLLGAGMAAYALSKMRSDTPNGRYADGQSLRGDNARSDEFVPPPHEAEPAVTPPTDFMPTRKSLEEEATTEEIQQRALEDEVEQELRDAYEVEEKKIPPFPQNNHDNFPQKLTLRQRNGRRQRPPRIAARGNSAQRLVGHPAAG